MTSKDSDSSNSLTRSTLTSTLWGHLLHRNVHSPLMSKQTPATLARTAPVDKAGTSMRILLHDTQATLENFSGRIDSLVGSVDDAKREISAVQQLFSQEHETLVQETVELVNRCQTEVQKSMGAPAQAPDLEKLCESVSSIDKRIVSLEQRVDTLHLLNQTQSQALQTIQDQQGQVLLALTPLLSVLQSIPLCIDFARNDIKDSIRRSQRQSQQFTKAPLPRKRNSDNLSSDTICNSPEILPGALPLSSPTPSQYSCSPSPRKKQRLDLNPPQNNENNMSSPILCYVNHSNMSSIQGFAPTGSSQPCASLDTSDCSSKSRLDCFHCPVSHLKSSSIRQPLSAFSSKYIFDGSEADIGARDAQPLGSNLHSLPVLEGLDKPNHPSMSSYRHQSSIASGSPNDRGHDQPTSVSIMPHEATSPASASVSIKQNCSTAPLCEYKTFPNSVSHRHLLRADEVDRAYLPLNQSSPVRILSTDTPNSDSNIPPCSNLDSSESSLSGSATSRKISLSTSTGAAADDCDILVVPTDAVLTKPKPMSLKDRRARESLMDTVLQKNEGKRYILLDDDEHDSEFDG